mmetsp:Transcript_37848/g.126638  ORF Transcript_37848/g.126638 Transcript_37848/m.126638 type:complete len:89 (+) Transcript_37848:613-879(+)
MAGARAPHAARNAARNASPLRAAARWHTGATHPLASNHADRAAPSLAAALCAQANHNRGGGASTAGLLGEYVGQLASGGCGPVSRGST